MSERGFLRALRALQVELVAVRVVIGTRLDGACRLMNAVLPRRAAISTVERQGETLCLVAYFRGELPGMVGDAAAKGKLGISEPSHFNTPFSPCVGHG